MTVPHLRFPFRIGPNGSADTVEQDSAEEVAQCVQVALMTTLGERIEVPTFGVSPVLFESASQLHADTLLRQATTWEPRASTTLDLTTDNIDQLVQHIDVTVASASATSFTETSYQFPAGSS